MTFNQAHEKLRGMFPEKYISLWFEMSEFAGKEKQFTCHLYIDGLQYFSGKTWDEAFDSLEKNIMEIKNADAWVKEQAPTEDIT